MSAKSKLGAIPQRNRSPMLGMYRSKFRSSPLFVVRPPQQAKKLMHMSKGILLLASTEGRNPRSRRESEYRKSQNGDVGSLFSTQPSFSVK